MAYGAVRWRNVTLGALFYNNARKKPQKTKEGILKLAKKQLPEDFDLSHFTPSYNPWDQRMCLIPDADLFLLEFRRKMSTPKVLVIAGSDSSGGA